MHMWRTKYVYLASEDEMGEIIWLWNSNWRSGKEIENFQI